MLYRLTTFLLLAMTCPGCGGANRIEDHRGDVTRCDLHDVELQEGVVPIHYGLPGRLSNEEVNALKRFPYANTSYGGGCVVSEDSPKSAHVRFCPKCRESEASWNRDYAKNVTKPIAEYMARIDMFIMNNDAFNNVHVYIHRDETRTVGFEGHVGSEFDLARLKRLAEEAKPPKPLVWAVSVFK